jgi:hypothetical protein
MFPMSTLIGRINGTQVKITRTSLYSSKVIAKFIWASS